MGRTREVEAEAARNTNFRRNSQWDLVIRLLAFDHE